MKFKLFPTSIRQRLTEISVTTPRLGLRNTLSSLSRGFFEAPTSPALRDTSINRDQARSLYFNTDVSLNQGAFLARPIVDGVADYIGTPRISVQDDVTNMVLSDWVNKFWKKPLWEMYKNSLREADTWVRVRKPYPSPLIAKAEEDTIELEVIDSDRVTPYYHPVTSRLIRVEILTRVYIEDEPFDPNKIYATGLHAHGREHSIVEIITPEQYSYFDATTAVLLENYTTRNDWGFVPCVQVFNDYDSALHGGFSELETVYPFFKALHDLVQQSRSAFKYIANPKIKFKLKDVATFLQNNFPDSYVDGRFTGRVSWKNTDVFFMEDEEDAEFIVAAMGVGEATTLMEFIIDCICMAAEMPESVLFRTKSEGSTNNDEYERHKIKIARKRSGFEEYLREITKMALKISGREPVSPTISWGAIQAQDLVVEATAINQIVTAAEVANRAGVISKVTYRAKIRPFFPEIKNDTQEDNQIQTEVTAEDKRQLELEKAMSAINPPKVTPSGPNGSGSGPSKIKRVRDAVPLDVVPVSPGN